MFTEASAESRAGATTINVCKIECELFQKSAHKGNAASARDGGTGPKVQKRAPQSPFYNSS